MRAEKIRLVIEHRWFLPAVAIITIILRLSLIGVAYRLNNPVFADEIDYLKIGSSLAHGHGFAKDGIHYTAYRPPAQPLMIALLFRSFGEDAIAIKVLEALLLSVIPFVCFRVGRLLNLSTASANVGAALASLHPALAYASSTLYPTVLTTVALTCGVWWCGRAALEPYRIRWAVWAGLALGVAGSATTTFAPLAILAGCILMLRGSFRSAVIIGLLGTLPVVLWMARNEYALGRFTVATNGGYNLYLGANDLATPMSGNWVEPQIFDPTVNEPSLDDEYRSAARIWIKKHPLHWGELVVARSIVVFDSVGNPKTQGLHSGWIGHLVGWLMLPVVLSGLIGLIVLYRNPIAWFTSAALFLIVASSAATIAKPRFRFPCDPLLAEFSVAGFLFVKNGVQSSGREEQKILAL